MLIIVNDENVRMAYEKCEALKDYLYYEGDREGVSAISEIIELFKKGVNRVEF